MRTYFTMGLSALTLFTSCFGMKVVDPCEVDSGYTASDGDGDGFNDCDTTQDCDPSDSSVYLGATELMGDDVDQDCDGDDKEPHFYVFVNPTEGGDEVMNVTPSVSDENEFTYMTVLDGLIQGIDLCYDYDRKMVVAVDYGTGNSDDGKLFGMNVDGTSSTLWTGLKKPIGCFGSGGLLSVVEEGRVLLLQYNESSGSYEQLFAYSTSEGDDGDAGEARDVAWFSTASPTSDGDMEIYVALTDEPTIISWNPRENDWTQVANWDQATYGLPSALLPLGDDRLIVSTRDGYVLRLLQAGDGSWSTLVLGQVADTVARGVAHYTEGQVAVAFSDGSIHILKADGTGEVDEVQVVSGLVEMATNPDQYDGASVWGLTTTDPTYGQGE